MPLDPSGCHVTPASVVCHIEIVSVAQSPLGSKLTLYQPSVSLTNEISGEKYWNLAGTGLWSQVAPRSVERYRYRASTIVQMTLAEAALSSADEGIGIGPGGLVSTPGMEVGVDGGLGVGVALEVGVVAAIGGGRVRAWRGRAAGLVGRWTAAWLLTAPTTASPGAPA